MNKQDRRVNDILDAILNPQDFIEIILGDQPTKTQLEIINLVADDSTREIAVRSCHSSGKSWIAVRSILWFLLNYRDSRVIVTAPTYSQVKTILFSELTALYKSHLKDVLEIIGIRSSEAQTMMLKFSDKWYALGLSTSEHSSVNLQGHHSDHMMGVVDEASGLSHSNDDIFKAIQGILASGKKTKLLMLGNPTHNSGYFYDCFQRLDSPKYIAKRTISAFDTPNYIANNIKSIDDLQKLSHEQITNLDAQSESKLLSLSAGRNWVDNYDKQQVSIRLLGEHAEQEDDSLIQIDDLKRAIDKQLTDDAKDIIDQDKGYFYLGCDIARFGSDSSVFIVRQGGEIVDIKVSHKKSTMASVGIIRGLKDKYDIESGHIHVDEGGIGSGVVDRLHEEEIMVKGVNSSSGADDDGKYLNKRAEMYYNLKEQFLKGKIRIRSETPHHKDLIKELSMIKPEPHSSGKLKIEPKDDIKKRIGKSPDLADALALAFNAKSKSLMFFNLGHLDAYFAEEEHQRKLKYQAALVKRQQLGLDKYYEKEKT